MSGFLMNPSTISGWGVYQDTQYTSGSPFSISADTDTILPNNKGTVIEAQKPIDVPTFYAAGTITGRNGDGILIGMDMKALPTSQSTTVLDFWLDVGGAIGQIFRRPITFPKGNGVERPIEFSINAYSAETWTANGATPYVRANGTCDLYDIRYVVTRTHKAR